LTLRGSVPILLTALAVVLGLILARRQNYLLFHTLVELITVAIALTVQFLVWNTRDLQENAFLRVIGTGSLAAASLDLIHTLAFKGMPIFPGYDVNLPTQLWIAARALQALSLLAAALAYGRRLDSRLLLLGYGGVTGLLIWAIFTGHFPDCYREGLGLTRFKTTSEYLVIAIILAALILLRRIREQLDRTSYRLVLISSWFLICAELAFTSYIGIYDLANPAGHLFKLAAYYALYRAVFVTGIQDPFNTLFRELKHSEQRLVESCNSVQRQVEERTCELRASQARLLESDIRLKLIASSLRDFIAILDLEGRISWISGVPAGISPAAAVGAPFSKSLDPETRAIAERALARCLATGGSVTYAGPGTRLTASPGWYEVRLEAMRTGEVISSVLLLAFDRTEARQSEVALRESEVRFEHLANQAPALIWMSDQDKRCTWFNQVWLDWTGRSLEQESGDGWAEGVHPEDLGRCLEIYVQHFDARQAFEMEYRLRHHGGQHRWVLDRGAPRFSEDGGFLGFIGACIDIQEAKAAAATLRESEARFRVVSEGSPVPLFLHRQGRFSYLNPAALEMLKAAEPADLIGQPVLDRVHPEDHQSVRERVQQAQATGQETQLAQMRMIALDGTLLDVEAMGRPVRFAGEETVLVFAKDITERNQAETLLRQERQRLASILSGTNVGTWEWNIQTGAMIFNQRWAEIIGYTLEELAPTTLETWKGLVHPDDLPACDAMLQRHFRGDQEFLDMEVRMRHKDGTWVWVLDRGQVMTRTEAGEPLLMMGTKTDISHHKQALLKINHDLEQRVSAEVAQRMQQERMLIHQARLAAMGEMIGNIAHQWRQPLGSLAMLLGNLKDARRFDQLTDAYLESSFQTGNQLIQKMSSTITDFSTFFRPNKEPSDFSLKAQTEEAIRLMALQPSPQGLTFELEGGDQVWAKGFPNESSQVVLNLLSNAREAIQASGTPAGRIRIRIAAEGGLATLRFADNGGGIRITPIERVFEPYLTDKPLGTGLGLYMSRMILEQSMAGTVTAENIPGGAEFRIALPLLEADHEYR
jgi:PAS domain S-box-containing protein